MWEICNKTPFKVCTTLLSCFCFGTISKCHRFLCVSLIVQNVVNQHKLKALFPHINTQIWLTKGCFSWVTSWITFTKTIMLFWLNVPELLGVIKRGEKAGGTWGGVWRRWNNFGLRFEDQRVNTSADASLCFSHVFKMAADTFLIKFEVSN